MQNDGDMATSAPPRWVDTGLQRSQVLTGLLALLLLGVACTGGESPTSAASSARGTGASPAADCPTTRPSGSPPPAVALLNRGAPFEDPHRTDWYGNDSLWTGLANWSIPSNRDPQTGLIAVKIPWFRAEPGQVQVSGKPFGGSPGTFRADVGTVAEYAPTGFVPSVLEFGRPGCWELTASLNSSQLAMVVDVLPPAS
jgi:hypothetical protein